MRYVEEAEWILRRLESKGATEFEFRNEDGDAWEGIEDCAYQVCNHEMGWVRFNDPVFKRMRAVFFVAGNSTGEIVSDYTIRMDDNDEEDIIKKTVDEFWAEVVEG